MGLDPIAFDIETSGLDDDAVVTVAGFAHPLGVELILNTGGRDADQNTLQTKLDDNAKGESSVRIVETESELLETIIDVAEKIDSDKHYGQQGDRINQNLQEKLEDGLAEVGK